MSSDVAGINATLGRYVAAVNACDVGAYGSTLTSDIVYMPPDSPSLHGREALVEWVKREFFDPYLIRFQAKHDDIHVSGARAVARGSFTLDLTPKAGGAQMNRAGKFMNVFRKESDGSWKFAESIFNFDSPAL